MTASFIYCSSIDNTVLYYLWFESRTGDRYDKPSRFIARLPNEPRVPRYIPSNCLLSLELDPTRRAARATTRNKYARRIFSAGVVFLRWLPDRSSTVRHMTHPPRCARAERGHRAYRPQTDYFRTQAYWKAWVRGYERDRPDMYHVDDVNVAHSTDV